MQRSVSIASRVETALTPILAHDGVDLVLVEFLPHGKVLRLFIDRATGVSLDDCTAVSRRVGDWLDAEGITEGPQGIAGHYTLEVSSPGLDRPLTRPEHFHRFVGQQVTVSTHLPITDAGRRKVSGELLAADAAGIRVATDVPDEAFDIAYDNIGRARLVPDL